MLRRLCGITDNAELFELKLQIRLLLESEISRHSSPLSDYFKYNAQHPSVELGRAVTILHDQTDFKHNAKALVSRITEIICKPTDMAPLILDICSLPLSFFSSARESEVEFLYPFSSITKRRSGRLARLILDHSRNVQQSSVREAMETNNPPCVAVINLDEVPQNITEGGYAIPADVHGFMITTMIFDILLSTCLYIFVPLKADIKGWWASFLGPRLRVHWASDALLINCAHLASLLIRLSLLCLSAVLRGDGVLVLVRKPGLIAHSSAVFLDHEFTAILTGSQSVVEAVAESNFNLIHPFWDFHGTISRLGRRFCYEVLKALCNGFFSALFLVGCLAFRPSSPLVVSASVLPAFGFSCIYAVNQFRELLPDYTGTLEDAIFVGVIILCTVIPPSLLLSAYEMVVAKGLLIALPPIEILLRGIALIPLFFLLIFLLSSRDFCMRTSKFLGILGNPPVRKWEFETLAAAATFQCLVLCRGITRPIKVIDTLALLDTFVPDQTDLWTAWKNRVADRIAHEVEISFTPTLPTFGDERQRQLKDLLDQAQVGYDAYRSFYDWHVPLYSM